MRWSKMEIPPRRLAVAMALIFLLGVLFAVVNGYYTEEEESPLPLIVYGLSFLSLVIGGVIILLFQWKISRIQMDKLLKVLPPDERTIISIIMNNNKTIEQNRLVALSGYSKVKISRLISELEERGTIRKKNLGNTNLIMLEI